jgi:hypothetical protein
MKKKPKPADQDTFWRPAFLPVLQLELEAYLDVLRFEAGHHLTTKPLQIDVVIIKKEKNQVIDNPIARIFRGFNVFEYKSPTVSLSIDEFYKGIVYVLLYKAVHSADIRDMSLSVVATQHPESVFGHIREVWKHEATEREAGIYEIGGFPFPVQIIENKELSKEANGYLRSLNNDLDYETLKWAIRAGKETHKIDVSAYLDVIARANEERLKEMFMNSSPALERII